MSFGQRNAQHIEYVNQVHAYLTQKGFPVISLGIENYLSKEQHNLLLKYRNHPVSIFVRFLPDSILSIGEQYYLFDVKSASKKRTNIAIEHDALHVYRMLGWLSIKVFLVIKDFQCCWADDVMFKRQFTNPNVLNTNQGSGTPFGLLDEVNTPILPLDSFLERISPSEVNHEI